MVTISPHPPAPVTPALATLRVLEERIAELNAIVAARDARIVELQGQVNFLAAEANDGD